LATDEHGSKRTDCFPIRNGPLSYREVSELVKRHLLLNNQYLLFDAELGRFQDNGRSVPFGFIWGWLLFLLALMAP
jgi:hypothetical protein